MKIHKVTVENLNSLYGKQTVDFDAHLSQAPVFLIVGQTGAGKSTILDAICLALFGETPRLRGSGKSGDSIKILSHGEAECRSILEFSKKTIHGRKRYRAEWYLYLARKKPGNKPQDPLRSLEQWNEEEEKWDPLVTRSRVQKEYKPEFDRVLEGIHVDDFLRSVLLAQGEFTRFLKASQDEKSRMLEKLTGTEDYTLYGSRAKRQFRRIDQEYQQLKSRMEGFGLLEEESAELLLQQKQVADETVAHHKKELQLWNERLRWEQHRQQQRKRLEECEHSHKLASEKLQERHEDQQRLNRHQHCLKAQEPLLRLRELETELLERQLESRSLQKREKELAPLHLEAQKNVAIQQEQLAKARKKLEDNRPLLREARNLQIQYREAGKLQEERQQRLQEHKQKLEEAHNALEKSNQQLEELQQRQTTLQTEQESLAHLRPLVTDWHDWKHKLLKLGEQQKQLQEQQQQLEQEKAQYKQELEEQGSEQLQKNEEQQLSKARQSLEAARSKVLAFLQDGEEEAEAVRRLQQAQEHWRVQNQSLRTGWSQWQRWQERKKDWDTESDKLKKQQEQQERWQTRLEEVQKTLQETEERAKEMEQEVRYATLSFQLVEERRQLQDGEACPLCQSRQHAFREHEDMKAFEQEVEERYHRLKEEETKQKTSLQELRNRVAEGRTHCKNKQGETREQEERCRQLYERLQSEEKQLSTDLLLTQLKGRELHSLEQPIFQEAIHHSEQALETALHNKEQFLEAQQELRTQEKLWQEAEHRWQTFQNSQQQKQQLLGIREEQLEKLAEETRQRTEAFETRTQALSETLAPLQLSLVKEEARILLEETLHQWEQARDKLAQLDKLLAEEQEASSLLVQHQQKTRSEQTLLQQRQEELLREETEITRKVQEYWQQLQSKLTSLEGEDPDLLETKWTQEVQTLEEEWKASNDHERSLQEEATNIHHRKEHCSKEIVRCVRDQGELEIRFKRILADLELEKREELEASLLPEDEARRLADQLHTLQSTVETTQQLLALQEGATQAAEQNPPAVPTIEHPPEEWTEDQLLLQQQNSEQRLEEAQNALGALIQRQKRQQEQSDAWNDMVARKKALETEWQLWKDMDSLIGVGDGRNFRTFAQALNLRQIADGANANLRTMAPRYRLSVEQKGGYPTLNFVIRDRHHANAERSLATLSGGETFLVSLALALALAEMHARDLQIESLLLDEGFGTLDPETLELALATLSMISSKSSQQIGIISHVEALKEKIEHKIVVRKKGNGRSQLMVQHGS